MYFRLMSSNSLRLSAGAAVLAVGLIGCASASNSTAEEEISEAQIQSRTESISRAHAQSQPELQRCFQGQEGEGRPESIEVELRLPASGTPASLRLLEPEKLDDETRACVEEALAGADYGEAETGQTFYQVIRIDQMERQVLLEKPVSAYKRWGLTRAEMLGVLVDNKSTIDACYRADEDEKEGRVVLTISVSEEGPPAKVALKSSTLESTEVNMCLVESVLDMSFPQPRGEGITVRDVPMRFSPEDGWEVPDDL